MFFFVKFSPCFHACMKKAKTKLGKRLKFKKILLITATQSLSFSGLKLANFSACALFF